MHKEHQKHIAETITRLREEQGWSQRQLAKWVGLDQSALSRIEAGRRRVSAQELQRFADALHVSADALLSSPPPGAPARDQYDSPIPPQPSANQRSASQRSANQRSASQRSASQPSPPPPPPLATPPRRAAQYGRSGGRGQDRLSGWDDPRNPMRDIVPDLATQEAEFARLRAMPSEPPGSGLTLEEWDDLRARVARNEPLTAEQQAFHDELTAIQAAQDEDEAERVLGVDETDSFDDAAPSSADADAGLSRMVGSGGVPSEAPDRPASWRTGAGELPAEVTAVVRDWFELRRLAGGDEPALTWSLGHSAEGRPARLAHPVQPAEGGHWSGDVLYDRVARFWRSELHVEPDDGPLPDLVTLLEDGLGAQVIVARVAGSTIDPRHLHEWDLRRTGRPRRPDAAFEQPVCASLNADAVPFLFVNAARPVVLQRFALAHAFAHLVLGHGDIVDVRIHWNRNNPREAAANDFTEEFLAPVRAVNRWYERHGEPRPELDTLLRLANAFGISAWSALYRTRAAGRLNPKAFGRLSHELHAAEWELLPRQAFLGGLRDTLAHLTPRESRPPGEFGPPAVLRVPASMRSWTLATVSQGRLSVEGAAGYLRMEARELAAQLARLGMD